MECLPHISFRRLLKCAVYRKHQVVDAGVDHLAQLILTVEKHAIGRGK